ncbi:alpha/beta hydrolase (plasmid) [Novosphingobium sp. BL-8A]|uniref:alpha/beta hydrolase n=1 Tax=Novosphingobium sp. BL-8A TaxID=3127639 RepID=UPI00375631C6
MSRFLSTITCLLSLGAATPALAQMPDFAKPYEAAAVPLYPKDGAGASAEIWAANGNVRNVSHPTLTAILPKEGEANGTAVIIAPGGAFMALSMEKEGWAIARFLAAHGVAAFVLKYRLIPTPVGERDAAIFMAHKMKDGLADPSRMPTLQNPDATADALAALDLVRSRAKTWKVDAGRVGMIGFSAGAMTTLNAVLTATPGKGPDFIGYIYGPQARVEVPTQAPPMFDAIAFDDPLFKSMGFPIAEAWKEAKRPVELHAYQRGGHGFGAGIPGTTTTMLMDEFASWLRMQGLLSRSAAH